MDVMLDKGEIDVCTTIRPTSKVTAGDATVIDRWGFGNVVQVFDIARHCEVRHARHTEVQHVLRPGWGYAGFEG